MDPVVVGAIRPGHGWRLSAGWFDWHQDTKPQLSRFTIAIRSRLLSISRQVNLSHTADQVDILCGRTKNVATIPT